MEGEVTEGHVVSGDFLKSVLLSLHGHQDVHLQDVLGAGELLISDAVLEVVQLVEKNGEEVLRVGAGALNGQTEEAGVTEVGVDGLNTVNEVIALHHVGDGTAVHSLAWAAR